MRTVEFFSGTASFSNVAKKFGYATFTIDNNAVLQPDLCVDILNLRLSDIPRPINILWASPPCEGFSVAAIGAHWGGGYRGYVPKTAAAKNAVAPVKKTFRFIEELRPEWFFIENPRGLLRKMPFIQHLDHRTVTYCQYGESRMKPTDIWTNAHWWRPRSPCSNGAACHEAAPRGAKSGTQGIKGARDRGRIPCALFEDIFDDYLGFRSPQALAAE